MKYVTICLTIIFLFSCRTGNASSFSFGYYGHHSRHGRHGYRGYHGYYGDHGRHGYYDDDYYYYRAPRVVEKRIIIHHQSPEQAPVYVDQNDSRTKDAIWFPGGYDVDGNYHEGYYTRRDR